MKFLQNTFLLQLLFITIIIFLVFGAWAIVQYGNSVKQTATVSFSGTGEIVITNDVATFSFTFSETDKNVAKARQMVSKQVEKAYANLEQSGIQKRDITTTSFTIYPKHNYIRPVDGKPGRRELSGYQVSHISSVRIRDIDQVGNVLDSISALKPHRVGSLMFTLDDELQKQAEEQAAALAIRDAKERAKRIAKQSGLKLKRIVGVRISSGGGNRYYKQYSARNALALASEGSAGGAAPKTPIEQGEDKLIQTATVTYELR